MAKPTWSDDQLRAAVGTAMSWRGVLRGLGLKSTSAGSIRTIQRRATQLGLDTSHFKRNRKWSDDQLREAVSVADSWRDVAVHLGIVWEGRPEPRLKGTAIRLGLDFSHLEVRAPKVRPAIEYLNGPARPSELRTAAHTLAAAWFSLRGFPVAFPTDPCPYDLLLTTPAGFQRAQVKSTTFQIQDGKWQVGIGHRPYALDKSASKDPYDPDEVDLFVIITGEGGLYVIPIEAVAGYTAIYLSSYEEYRVGDVSSMMN